MGVDATNKHWNVYWIVVDVNIVLWMVLFAWLALQIFLFLFIDSDGLHPTVQIFSSASCIIARKKNRSNEEKYIDLLSKAHFICCQSWNKVRYFSSHHSNMGVYMKEDRSILLTWKNTIKKITTRRILDFFFFYVCVGVRYKFLKDKNNISSSYRED
jgi:hypothetical protein